MRASYNKQLAEVQQQTASLMNAQQELHAAQASLAAGEVAHLVTRVDVPRTGAGPRGPGRAMIAAVGCVGGILVALAVLVLTLPAAPPMAGTWPREILAATNAVEENPAQVQSAAEPAATVTPRRRSSHAPVSNLSLPPAISVPSPPARARGTTLHDALLHCGSGDAHPTQPRN